MGRLIDEDEFIKNVVKYTRHSTKTIGEALKQTPTVDVCPNLRWIPITEQKPPLSDRCLVTLYWEPDDEGDEFYDVCEMEWGVYHVCGYPIANQVIAWMPLPEPYKKADGGAE